MNPAHSNRRKALLREITARKLDGLLITHPANWYYLTGFTGEAGALVVSQRGVTLVTDGRFTVQAREETRGVRVELQQGGLYTSVGAFLKKAGLVRVGFDANQLTVAQHHSLQKAMGSKWRGREASGLVERLRMKKDPQELVLMRKAALLVGEVFQSVLKLIRPGVRETEIAAELEYQMKKRAASGPAFETIVASGPRGALPHARPTAKRLRKNEFVVLDLGVILGHYCSDMTRTVYLGRAARRAREWYRAVQDAQEAAVAAVKAGVTCGEVDAAARDVLKKSGLDEYFVHSTGHGLGLEVHEDPRIGRGQTVRLEAGNAITIEPGVYLEGIGGIRIEDDVVVGAGRSEVLTRVTRDLIEL
ncbi:MAG TPA: Xaa-Pro peptidase family protein [Candidatus Eisenbacteria bacterium]|nr:Xaa-Pro peptidase family protein [Candidatus Eisenbacteria bacterium]